MTSNNLPSVPMSPDGSVNEHLLDHMLDVITFITESGAIAFQSKSIQTMLGYQAEPMLGESVTGYIHPEDVPRVESAIHRLLSGQVETDDAEFRFRHKNGDYRRIHAVARVWDWSGTRGVLVNSRDITSAHEAKVELAKQNELLSKTFEVSKNLLSISLPTTGKLLKVNDAWCQTLGHSRESVVGKTVNELGIWGAVGNRGRVLSELERKGELQNFESIVYTKTGEERLMIIDAQLLLVADEPQILMSCTDVTESRKTEELLRQSQKMEAIGQLTGGVAHDFNNLIGVTMGNAELLLDTVANQPEALEYAQQIYSAAERGASLTQQLLAFSRKQTLSPESIDLANLLAQANSILQTTVSENTIVDISSEPGLWKCKADPNQLQTALLNLTLNAHDAMPSGGLLRFEMSNYEATGAEHSVHSVPVISELSAGKYVALKISDTGTGMDSATRLRAFEPFFSTKERGRGTGLGLSMVLGFVVQSGGALCLDSRHNRGTTLILLLPQVSRADQITSPPTGDSVTAQRRFAAHRKTVLIVEDSEPLRSVLVRALSDMGYRVLEASGEEDLARILVSASSIDALLSDVILKDRKRGPDIAEDVLRRFPEASVLLMTGFSPDDVLKDSQYPILMKPFTLVQLSEVLHRLLASRTVN